MAAPDRKTEPAAPMRGEIQGETIPELLAALDVRRATGTLVVSTAGVRRTVLLQAGRVQFAASNDRDDRFNQVLIKAGVIPLKNLLRALEVALATHDRLGEVLVKMKMLSAGDVEKYVRMQVRQILFGIVERPAGQWSFEPGPIAAESIRLDQPGRVVAFEAVRRLASWTRVYERVGGLNAEYLGTSEVEAIAPGLPLLPGERALLTMCRTPTSLGEMCDASQMGDFQVCRSVWGLLLAAALMKA